MRQNQAFVDSVEPRWTKVFTLAQWGGSPIFVAVYVDDLVIVGTDENIELVLSELRAKSKIKDLGPVTDLLHMEVSDVPGEALWMSQRGSIDKLLRRFGIEDCRPVATPQALGNIRNPRTGMTLKLTILMYHTENWLVVFST
ncbi:unnamed protein product [Phytophthora fragariaefolia]|uniref:Unnamed protein product n=1 Tax=Phytophthora fragariaefolia TaxID=1490495 RepID=A0A9W6X9C9_9STRA|nr:unnamed protein product [Phytophthora fragariaefolia]